MPTLLLTRAQRQSQELLDALQAALGREVAAVISPLARHVATGVRPSDGVALAVTSGRAAEMAGDLSGRMVYAVGDRTAALARAAGAQAVSAGGTVEDLLDLLLRVRPTRIEHLRGDHGRGDLAPRLRAAGIDAGEAVVYRTEDLAPTDAALALLDGTAPVLAPVYSPRSARRLAGLPRRAPLEVVAISAAAGAAFEGSARVDVAARPDGPSMLALLLRRLGNLS